MDDSIQLEPCTEMLESLIDEAIENGSLWMQMRVENGSAVMIAQLAVSYN